MIHEEICTFEVAKLAKEKGFNEKCYHYYQNRVLESDECFNRYNKGVDNVCSAPTQSLLQRWLREEKKVQIIIKPKLDNLGAWIWGRYSWVIFIFDKCRPMCYTIRHGDNSTYGLALEDALKYALENLV